MSFVDDLLITRHPFLKSSKPKDWGLEARLSADGTG